LILLFSGPAVVRAEVPRVLPPGELPRDKRLGELENLNGYFPFTPCTLPEAWAKRSERVRRQILVATGLWPMPSKTPARAVIHGKVDRDEYTVEKVYLESFPGHCVTGSLYRPKGRSGRLAAVLCPHGHWANGRFYDAGEEAVKQQIAKEGERFDPSGRYPVQARCMQLARMGCVVFHYDMVGYADSKQLSHRPGIREEMNTPEDWGYFSPQAEARLQNMMGLQTYNSTRALDFLIGLPDVDPKRIAVTGASGGGTQTFILSAIDPRPAVAFPAVMVSTAMQGGCTCENACYLRLDTGNVEIAALFSPRPLGLTAADDWTKEMTTKGFPELKQHYEMLGVADHVMLHSRTEFGHNYNYPSRAAMYHWVNKHLALGLEEPIVEEDFKPLSIDEMSVWNAEHPEPPGGDDHERALLKWITEDSQKQMAALLPTNKDSLAEYRRIVGGAVDVLIGRGLPEPGSVKVDLTDAKTKRIGDQLQMCCRVQYPARGEEILVAGIRPADVEQWNRQIVVWVDRSGKRSIFDDQGDPRPAIKKLLAARMAVIGIDLFGQGEFTKDGEPPVKARLVRDDYAGYTFGYNYPLFAQRVHDILSLVSLAKSDDLPAEKVYLVGLGGAGHWVAAAAAQAGDAVDGAVIDTAGFRFANLTAIDDPDFLPGGAKYGDLSGVIALAAPTRLWLTGEGPEAPPIVAAAYQAAGRPDNLTVFTGQEPEKEVSAIEWLLR
jgi:dienelactone hydrolase